MSTNETNLVTQMKQGVKSDWFTVMPTEVATTATRTATVPVLNVLSGMMFKVITATEVGVYSATFDILTVDAGGNSVVWYRSADITTATTNLFLIHPDGGTNTLFTIVPFPLPRNATVALTYTGTPANDKMTTTVYGCYV